MSAVELRYHWGDTEIYDMTITDFEGNPVDLTSVEDVVFRAASQSGTTAVIEHRVGEGLELGEDPGTATVTLTVQDMTDADIPNDWATLMYDVSVEADPATPIEGQLRILPTINDEALS